MKSEETKKRLMNSAHKLFHQKGFEATSVREIVEDAGYAKGTFYLYFETKMDLLKGMMVQLSTAFNDITYKHLSQISEDPFGQMDALLEDMVENLMEQACCVRMVHTQEILDILMMEGMSELFVESTIQPIQLFLEKGIEKGYFRSLDTLLYAKMLYALAHNSLETAILYQYPSTIENVTKELKLMIRKIVEK